jgi:hypothetical protein
MLGGIFGIALLAGSTSFASAETYRLVHAIGNEEEILAEGLSQQECQDMKSERVVIVARLNVAGSITCLPESLFDDTL